VRLVCFVEKKNMPRSPEKESEIIAFKPKNILTFPPVVLSNMLG
jgi:hypothetical protein